MSNSNLKLATTIIISMDHILAGSGNLVNGRIEGCGAQFSDDQDESEVIIEMIEEMIEAGNDAMKVEIDGRIRKITWRIVEAGVDEARR